MACRSYRGYYEATLIRRHPLPDVISIKIFFGAVAFNLHSISSKGGVMKRTEKVLAIALMGMFVGAVLTIGLQKPVPAVAQQNPSGLNVRVTVAGDSYQALKDRAVMVSVIHDGAVLRQTETGLNSNVRFPLPVGLYDVRLEGDGMETLVKRGIHVTANETTQIVGGPMRAGTGVRIVEYAVGGLSREEVAARLQKLEASVGKLEAAVDELQKERQAGK
jgi:hypothetical protein